MMNPISNFTLRKTLANVNVVHVRYMSSSARLSSVTFARPTQAIEIFGNVSMPFGTLAIHDLSVKILRRSSQSDGASVECSVLVFLHIQLA